MTKSIKEALAEVQRKINEQRTKNAEANWENIQEGGGGGAGRSAKKYADLNRPTATQSGLFQGGDGEAAVKFSKEVEKTPEQITADKAELDRLKASSSTPQGEMQRGAMNVQRQSTAQAQADSAATRAQQAKTDSKDIPPPNAAPAPAPTANAAPAPAPTANVPLPPPRPANLTAPKPAAAPKQVAKPAAPQAQSAPAPKPDFGYAQSGSDADTAANFFSSNARQTQSQGQKAPNSFNIFGSEEESGGKTKKKSVKESTLIDAFMKLQASTNPNIFEAAKKMKGVCPRCGKSPCQCDGDPKKMEEENLDEMKRVWVSPTGKDTHAVYGETPDGKVKRISGGHSDITARVQAKKHAEKHGLSDTGNKGYNYEKSTNEETVDEAYGSNEGKTATGTKWSDNSVSVSVHHDGKKHTFTGKHDYVAKKLKAAHGMGMHQVNFKKASDMKEEALDEKLIGNQKKLDKNHNNKLDSEDFKMLRGKKMEEAKKPKPDYLDMDNDGNKKESMKKAIKDKKMKDYRSDRDKHGEMEEEVEELDELSKKTLGSYINKATADATDAARRGGAADAKNAPSFAKGAYKTVEKRQAGIYNATKKLTKEEVEFSAEELAHIASIMEADAPAVAKVDANKNYKVNAKGNEVGTSPTAGDLTDETITEGRRKPGVELKKPGRPVGSKSGSRHASSGNKGEDEVSAPSAVPHVLDQIRHAHERGATDEHGTYTLTHPADRTKTAKVSRKEAHGFYTDYHGTEKPEHKEKKYKEFLGHHFGGDDRTHAPTHHAFNTDLGSIEKANLSTSANRAKVTLAKTGK